jgi:hypothetical protein
MPLRLPRPPSPLPLLPLWETLSKPLVERPVERLVETPEDRQQGRAAGSACTSALSGRA